ncbi:hypothetical protein MYCTH_2037146, partial [Thermothelomyces thermophilus ATCC 42464]
MPTPTTLPPDEEDDPSSCSHFCAPITSLTRPVDLSEMEDRGRIRNIFCLPPPFGPLLFDNEQSDCRDHCANERTFLSYLRLSIYMSIVAVAIVLSFHLRKTASEIELRMAKPLGAIFWALSKRSISTAAGRQLYRAGGRHK